LSKQNNPGLEPAGTNGLGKLLRGLCSQCRPGVTAFRLHQQEASRRTTTYRRTNVVPVRPRNYGSIFPRAVRPGIAQFDRTVFSCRSMLLFVVRPVVSVSYTNSHDPSRERVHCSSTYLANIDRQCPLAFTAILSFQLCLTLKEGTNGYTSPVPLTLVVHSLANRSSVILDPPCNSWRSTRWPNPQVLSPHTTRLVHERDSRSYSSSKCNK